MKTSTTVLLTLLGTLVLVVVAGLIFIYSGAYDVAAVDEHSGLVRWALTTTQARSVRAHADTVRISLPTDSASIRRGFRTYQQMCVVCHGAPGIDRGWMGQGLNPTPPDLSKIKDFDDRRAYWIVANGIKMAGMPALKPTHERQEMLEIVAFLKQLPRIKPAEYEQLRRTLFPAASAMNMDDEDEHEHDHHHHH